MPVDIGNAENVNLGNQTSFQGLVEELPPLPKAGYNLSRIILALIGLYILFIIIYIINDANNAGSKMNIPSDLISDSNFTKRLELFKAFQEEHQNSRNFFMQITQMVLLNLLLPTLAAILGYIFGTREKESGS